MWPSLRWHCREHVLTVGPRPLVMGIVNVTPDSFSDGGRFLDPAAGVDQGLKLVADGADLLDVGGESTRPGATPVPLDEELRRVIPVVPPERDQVQYLVDPFKGFEFGDFAADAVRGSWRDMWTRGGKPQ